MREKPKGGRPKKEIPYKEIISMSKEYSIPEMAEMFKVSKSTISNWRRKAYQQLRQQQGDPNEVS